MPVVCGTNLSEWAVNAASVAAAMAERLGEPLWLLGVFDAEHSAAEVPDSAGAVRQRLDAEAARLRQPGLEVRAWLMEGAAAEVLVRHEACQQARLVVLAAEGWGPVSTWRRTPVPEWVAQHTRVPVLVVRRGGGALLDWARGRRRLLVLTGVDDSRTATAAVAWLKELRQVGACDVVAAYVCSPVEERERLGIHTPVHLERLAPAVRNMERLDPQVERVLLRELRERVGTLPGEGQVELHLEPGYGRPADHLLHVAHQREVDLLVVGTHQREGLARLWHGSVSAGVLRRAEQSVVCVPPVLEVAHRAAPPRTVLVPVDFSEASLQAISQASQLVPSGGRVHLLHVRRRRRTDTHLLDHYGVLPEPPHEQAAVMARLEALVPRDAGARPVQWTLEGVSGDDVTQAICQAAEREGADLVCLGTSEEPGHAGYLNESRARELIARCRRPVMVLHGPALSQVVE